jgi:hypothetical protein
MGSVYPEDTDRSKPPENGPVKKEEEPPEARRPEVIPRSPPGTDAPGAVRSKDPSYFFLRMGIPVLAVSWTT